LRTFIELPLGTSGIIYLGLYGNIMLILMRLANRGILHNYYDQTSLINFEGPSVSGQWKFNAV